MKVKRIFRQDYKQTKSLIKAGKISSQTALRRSKALDLDVTFIEKGVVFKELPNGSKIQIGTVQIKPIQRVLVKGMVLHGK